MRGGVHLLAHKDRPIALSIARASVPKQLTFSIVSPNKSGIAPLVEIGSRVLLGQPIAECDAGITHSSVSGAVVTLNSHQGHLSIVIENDERDEPHPSIVPVASFESLPSHIAREHIRLSGVLGLGGAAYPTGRKLQAAAESNVELLIVNAAECEPYIACDDALMREQAVDVLSGTQALLHASGARHAVIAIESNKPDAITCVTKALADAKDPRVTIRIVDSIYPTGGERQLVKLITGKEVPSGGIPPHIGVLCQNVGTAAAVARLIRTGEPLINRVITVTGSGVTQPKNLYARLGTPIASLIRDCGGYQGQVERLIMGGSMMGVALETDELPVTAATNCIVAATAHDIKSRLPEMPCIRCGDCAHACPAGLLPQQLLRFARLRDQRALRELGLRDCIECGCCDYVCPSQIPLTSQFVAAKQQQ